MKIRIKRLAVATTVIAISVGLGLAPVAAAATGGGQPTSPPTTAAPAPPQYETGTNPLVPTNTGALPYVLVPRGYGLAF